MKAVENLQKDKQRNKLRDYRIEKSLTQEKLAAELGVTVLSVGRWERGEIIPSLYYMRKICDFFNATPEELGLLQEEQPTLPAFAPGTNIQELPAANQDEKPSTRLFETQLPSQKPQRSSRLLTRRTLLLSGSSLALATAGLIGLVVASQRFSEPSTSLIYRGHVPTATWGVAWSPDDQQIASTGFDGTMQVWNASTGHLLFHYKHRSAVLCVAWSPDGKYLASGDKEGVVHVYSVALSIEIYQYKHDREVRSVAWSLDSQYLASGSFDQTVRVWSISTKTLRWFLDSVGSIWSVAWSPNGKYLALGSVDTRMYVYDASKGQLLNTYHGHSSDVSSVAWSPDGTSLVSGSFDGTVRVWRASPDTGPIDRANAILTYWKHAQPVQAVAWSPDGYAIASGAKSPDTTIQVWQAMTGGLICECRGHTNDIHAISWSHEPQWIASTSLDKLVRVWRLEKSLVR